MSSAEALRDVLRFLNAHEFKHDSDDGPLHIEDDTIVAGYATLLLGSSFQPIVAEDDRVIGHKALVIARSSTRRDYRILDIPELTPAASVHSPVANDNREVIYRDRLTRTMHALNYLASELDGDLHMSVNPQHLQAVHKNHGEVFEKILAQCGLEPDRIVLEIPEYAVTDKQHLRAAIAGWQQRRYRIAIDRFGAEHTQLARVLALKPDIIKFDGSFIARLSASAATKKKLQNMLEQIRDNDIHAVATGIDNGALYDAARAYPFFALQGQWFTERVAEYFSRTDNLRDDKFNQRYAHNT